MKPKTLILMVVAVICGLGASYMTSRLLAEREEAKRAPEVVEIPKVKILVAKKSVPMGNYLKTPQDLFTVKEVAADSAPKDALSDPKVLQNKTLKRTLPKDGWVLPDDLQDGPTSLDPPPGYQALGLRVTIEGTAHGFGCVPGSRVDLIWNHRGNRPENTFSKTLLQNVLVLAADGVTQARPEGGAIPAQVVTFAFTRDEVKMVSLASEHGTLRLALRKPGDDKLIDDKESAISLAQLIKGLSRKEEPEDDFTEPMPEPPVVAKVPEAKQPEPPAPKVEAPRERPYTIHFVEIRQGEHQRREAIKIDRKTNRPYVGDVEQVDPPAAPAPQVGPPRPTQQPQSPAPPPARKD